MLIKEILNLDADNRQVKVEGWVRSRRDSKEVVFVAISDGSCQHPIQAVFDLVANPGFKDALEHVQTGAAVTVEGSLVPSPGQKQNAEVLAAAICLEGAADPTEYPLQKKRHSLEFLREIAHLRPRSNTISAVMRVRNELSMAVHDFFQKRGFYYIHTPIISAVDAEGAGAMFQVTTLDSDELKKTECDYSQDFFGRKTYLAVTGQLEAETYALAMKQVYTFGPTFRAEHSNTTRHLAEFWMIEPEMAFCDIDGNMDIAEGFLKYILGRVLENCSEELDFFNSFVSPGLIDSLQAVAKKDFARISYAQVVKELEKAAAGFEYQPAWGKDLQSEHEKYLTEKVFGGPVIVTDYPREIKAFYMKQNSDELTVRAMDVLVPRLGEIIGGSERESDINKLKARMQELGLATQDYWWYLDLRRFGSVRHSGFGLGFERLIQYVTGMQNIRDVIPYPRSVGSIGF